jgi:hypothetical protein
VCLQEFFREPEGVVFGPDLAIGLGFGDVFKELANEWARPQVEATNQFAWLDDARWQNALSLADVALEQQTHGC